MNNILKLISTLYIILIIIASSNSYAEDKTIIMNEAEETRKEEKEPSCTTKPCNVDVDALLDELIDESKKDPDPKTSEAESELEKEISEPDLVNSLIKMDRAEIIILNKITAKSESKQFKIGERNFFGNISIEVRKCIKNTDPLKENNIMLISVFENKIEDANRPVFHGWVFSANPSVSTLEHPVYELIPVKCTASEKK